MENNKFEFEATNKMLLDMLELHKYQSKKNYRFFSIIIIVLVILVAILIFQNFNLNEKILYEVNATRQDFIEFMDSIEYTETTTTTTEVVQDTGEGNGNNIYQSGE